MADELIRTEIRLSKGHRDQLEQLKAQRDVSFNQAVASALDQFFAPAGTSNALELIHQRLWNLDAAAQKSAERLLAIEEGLAQTMESVVALLEQVVAPPVLTPPEVARPSVPVASAIRTDPTPEPELVELPARRFWFGQPR